MSLRRNIVFFCLAIRMRYTWRRCSKPILKHLVGGSLDDHFEKAYYSHVMGMRKPDIESFQYIMKENGLAGNETLFVDDAMVNVQGAEQAGLKGLYLRPGISLLDFLW